jgi:glycine C-acetyltransferase
MKDLFAKLERSKGNLGNYADKAEGYYMFPKLEGELGSRMFFQGKEVIVWSINDYLGLGNHPEVREADKVAAEKWGLSYPMGSRMMSGQTDSHERLERELAEFVGKEASFLLNFGYQGFASVIDAIVDRNDVIVYDSESHACLIDGVRMHLGKRFAFEHNNIESLEKNLKRAQVLVEKTGGGILVISEGVFGMRGDQGKIKEIAALKTKYNFRFMVDDAHGFGTLGATGAGTGEEQGCQDEIDIYLSTFAKSLASIGAFVAADAKVINFLKYLMRSQIFAKSLPMPIVEGNLKRLELLKSQPQLRNKLWENVKALQMGLKERGFNVGDTSSCVTPVYLNGSVEEAMALVYDLRSNYSIFCSIVVYPVVPKGMMILRLIPTAYHTAEDIDLTLQAFSFIKEKLESGAYAPKVPV